MNTVPSLATAKSLGWEPVEKDAGLQQKQPISQPGSRIKEGGSINAHKALSFDLTHPIVKAGSIYLAVGSRSQAGDEIGVSLPFNVRSLALCVVR